MGQAHRNPQANALGRGITEEEIKSAIEQSGYPLQMIAGDVLRAITTDTGRFFMQEEWSFVDRDSQELRSIDLLAELRLHGWKLQPRVRPQLDIVIECKQSQLPYIFFQARRAIVRPTFPAIAGLRSDKIVLTSDDDPSTWTLDVIHALDLDGDPFQLAPPFCYTLSKCVRKGANIELSGSDAYNALVLPLVKAVHHFVRSQTPVSTAWYFDCHLTSACAIVDAPMISVDIGTEGPMLTASPWVRVLRHEYEKEAEHFDREQLRVIDVVHKDFFSTYLNEHLLPFADRFAARVLRHTTELATGLAFVPRMAADTWSSVENRMQPRTRASRQSRTMMIGRNIFQSLMGKKRRD